MLRSNKTKKLEQKTKNCFDFRPLSVVTRENLNIFAIMGFLHKLWDETLAGPMPDTGLGKLRKYDSFSVRSSPHVNSAAANSNEEMNVTRSITIIRTSSSNFRNFSVDPGSASESPSQPSTPGTPLTPGTPRGDFRRITRRKSSVEALENAEPRSLTVYDWVVINALDR